MHPESRMVALTKYRELLLFVPIYAWLSFINYAIKLWLAPSWFYQLEENHAALLKFQYTNNEQSRLLQFYIPEFLHQVLGITVLHSYALARLTFIFLTYVCFHYYLRKWFTTVEAFAAVLLLAVIIPFTHMNDLQESAPLLGLLFLLALQAIRDNRLKLLMVIFIFGGLTNETMLILPSVYFFFHVRFTSLRTFFIPAGKAFLIGIPLIATLGPIRYYNRERPHLGGGYHWPDNIRGILEHLNYNPLDLPYARYVLFILFFGVLWYYALAHYASKPLFLRRAAWMIPLFILGHLITGKINESRQMIPLSFIVIPMAMFSLLRVQETTDAEQDNEAYESRRTAGMARE
jgi:hypothetical protein